MLRPLLLAPPTRTMRGHACTFLLGLACCDAPPVVVHEETPASLGERVEVVAEPPPPPPTIAPGNDAPPERPSTREESARMQPAWAAGLPEPGPSLRAQYFREWPATPTEVGTLSGAAVICALGVHGATDRVGIFDGVDMTGTLTIGGEPAITEDGAEDSPTMYLSRSLVSLRPGQTIRATIVDRDVLRDVPLGTVAGKYAGTMPWVKKAGRLDVECRALAGETLTAVVDRGLADADSALTEAARLLRFEAEVEPDFGFSLRDGERARGAISRVAGLVGWADPRVQRRLEWLGRIEAPFFAAASEHVAAMLAEAPPAGTAMELVPGQILGRVEDVSCGPDAVERVKKVVAKVRLGEVAERGGCVVRVRIGAMDDEGLRLSAYDSAIHEVRDPRLMLTDGSSDALEVLGVDAHPAPGGRFKDDPKLSAMLLLVPRRWLAMGTGPRPALLLARDWPSKHTAVLRVP